MDNNELALTNRLLGVVVALLVQRDADGRPTTVRQRVAALDELGLKPSEIVRILGKTNSYVSKELVSIRRNRK